MASTNEMTFEEKFEAFMKNYQAVPSSKAELEKQNEYLQKLLEDDMKQKQKALESPSASIHNEDEASNLNSSSSDEEWFKMLEERPKTQMISKLKFLGLRVNWILMSF